MCAHNPAKQVRAHENIAPGPGVFFVNAGKPEKVTGFSFVSDELMQYAG